jgi:hypothetical protein
MIEQIINFIIEGLKNLGDLQTITVGAAVVILLNLAFLTWLPNTFFEKWGMTFGRTASKKGRKILGPTHWERIENTLFGSVYSFVRGAIAGADEDDTETGGV